MALVADIRKNVIDTTPVFAVVGLTDLAVEKVRDARVRATTVGAALTSDLKADLTPAAIQTRAQASVLGAAEQAQELPALALNRSLELAGKAQESYETVAARGEKLVKRVRTQKATKDLIAQAETTVALGKGAVTTVRRSANDIQRSAKATLTTGRKEAATVADAVASSVAVETTEVGAAVQESAKRTRTAAKRTSTTTKKSATATRSATKRATTGARKTASTAKKASTTAATKVGD
jgi:heparin binding hemagglutinin HbhA